ncbi:hypothetical protein MTO96_005204 [Rhipicephalus appendiculatus]
MAQRRPLHQRRERPRLIRAVAAGAIIGGGVGRGGGAHRSHWGAPLSHGGGHAAPFIGRRTCGRCCGTLFVLTQLRFGFGCALDYGLVRDRLRLLVGRGPFCARGAQPPALQHHLENPELAVVSGVLLHRRGPGTSGCRGRLPRRWGADLDLATPGGV